MRRAYLRERQEMIETIRQARILLHGPLRSLIHKIQKAAEFPHCTRLFRDIDDAFMSTGHLVSADCVDGIASVYVRSWQRGFFFKLHMMSRAALVHFCDDRWQWRCYKFTFEKNKLVFGGEQGL